MAKKRPHPMNDENDDLVEQERQFIQSFSNYSRLIFDEVKERSKATQSHDTLPVREAATRALIRLVRFSDLIYLANKELESDNLVIWARNFVLASMPYDNEKRNSLIDIDINKSSSNNNGEEN